MLHFKIIACFGVIPSICSATNTLDTAITSFPDLRAQVYRPDAAVHSANILISAGKALSLQILDNWANSRPEGSSSRNSEVLNEKICHLCRLLFVPVAEPLRPPNLGALEHMPFDSMSPENWPDLPFAIINDIPISVNLGYMGVGVPERAKSYLGYCKEHGIFREKPFPLPTSAKVSDALKQLMTSPAWKSLKWKDNHYNIDESESRKALWEQARNITNAITGRK